MLNINEKKKYVTWVEYEKGEKYQIEYWPLSEFDPSSKDYEKNVLAKIKNWSGVYAGELELTCDDETKKAVFIENDDNIEVAKRIEFLIKSMITAKTFFDAEGELKN